MKRNSFDGTQTHKIKNRSTMQIIMKTLFHDGKTLRQKMSSSNKHEIQPVFTNKLN